MHRRRWREPHGWGGCGRVGRCVGKGAPPQPENEVRVWSVLERRTGQRAWQEPEVLHGQSAAQVSPFCVFLGFFGFFFFAPFMFMSARCLYSWTKERRVLLVKSFEKKKWVVVRPLPFSRTYPQQYDVSFSPPPLSRALDLTPFSPCGGERGQRDVKTIILPNCY